MEKHPEYEERNWAAGEIGFVVGMLATLSLTLIGFAWVSVRMMSWWGGQ